MRFVVSVLMDRLETSTDPDAQQALVYIKLLEQELSQHRIKRARATTRQLLADTIEKPSDRADRERIRFMVDRRKRFKQMVNKIVEEEAAAAGITIPQLLDTSLRKLFMPRRKMIVRCIAYARSEGMSDLSVARALGFDHTTVMHALKKHAAGQSNVIQLEERRGSVPTEIDYDVRDPEGKGSSEDCARCAAPAKEDVSFRGYGAG